MPINFIPNDPLALASLSIRKVEPRPNRPANRAGFNFFGAVNQGVFNPGTPEFLFWQCREAALLAVEVWESLNGKLNQWAKAQPNIRKLDLIQDVGLKLNAFYDTQSLQFFHNTTGPKTTFSGASTDVVSHEAGHAFLDTLRPEIFGVTVTELGAFHEAFGDCMALLTGLFDKATRVALLKASPDLGAANFLEATAEDLSDGVRLALGPNHPAAAPRHALNNFKFQLPTTLPTTGPPTMLTSEIHSFGRVFSGCFYDTIRNIFNAFPQHDEASLLIAATTAGKLLIAGAKQAPEIPRFFQSVGRAMVLADRATNGGHNAQAVATAFARHGIALGSTAMLAPRASLAGGAPALEAKSRGPLLAASTTKDIKTRLQAATGARLFTSAVDIGGTTVVKAVHHREVSLSSMSKKLKGVIAVVPEALLVGAEGTSAAALSAIPDPNTSADEVNKFVETLLEHDRIAFAGDKPTARKARASTVNLVADLTPHDVEMPTFVVRAERGKKVLTRIRFTCSF
jgi:hypothetical protein